MAALDKFQGLHAGLALKSFVACVASARATASYLFDLGNVATDPSEHVEKVTFLQAKAIHIELHALVAASLLHTASVLGSAEQ
jgi:hypothetical protein